MLFGILIGIVAGAFIWWKWGGLLAAPIAGLIAKIKGPPAPRP